MEQRPASFTRRKALALIATALAGMAAHGADLAALAGEPPSNASDLAATFGAFCDGLIPADELSPSASALGVPARILDEARANPQLLRLVEFSCGWMDQAAGGRFAGADDGLRDGILEAMAGFPWEAPQRRFFDLTRDLAMGFYYSQPAALRGMATEQPPQPGGYFQSLE